MPQNFGLEYVDSDGSKRRPVVIHRVVYGSIERFLGILIEHTAGILPFWIAPVQVRVLPLISGSYVSEVVAKLRSVVLDKPLRLNELRIEVDDKDSLSHRIRDAELAKVPVIAIVGEKEAANRTVTLRSKLRGEQIRYEFSPEPKSAFFFLKILEYFRVAILASSAHSVFASKITRILLTGVILVLVLVLFDQNSHDFMAPH